jgi:sec-independent protein translocase protein TatB
MFDLGTQELIVIFIVAFLVFGPKRLPELGRTLGKGLRDLKTAMRGVKDTFEEAGTGITDELKEAKSDLEDSIYKSIESKIEEQEDTKEQEQEKEEPQTNEDIISKTEEEGEKKKETDTDG